MNNETRTAVLDLFNVFMSVDTDTVLSENSILLHTSIFPDDPYQKYRC